MSTINRSYRVLHIITRLAPGGSTINTLVSVDRLREYDIDTELVYGHTEDRTYIDEIARRKILARYERYLVRNINPLFDFIAYLRLLKVIRKGNYHLVHTHTSKAGVVGRLAAITCGLPAVHTPHGHILKGYFNPFLTFIFKEIEKVMAKRTERLIALSRSEMEESIDAHIGTYDKFCIVPSGVPLKKFMAVDINNNRSRRRELGINDNCIVLISVGRLEYVKGYDILLNSLKILFTIREWKLLLVGDGSMRALLERDVRSTGLKDRVIFTGYRQDIENFLGVSDIFVLVSRNEGMGRALVEALAVGIPAIVSNVGGLKDIVRDGFNGLVVEPENVFSLASAIKRLIEDDELRFKLKANTKSSVYPYYDEDNMIMSLVEIYKEILEGL